MKISTLFLGLFCLSLFTACGGEELHILDDEALSGQADVRRFHKCDGGDTVYSYQTGYCYKYNEDMGGHYSNGTAVAAEDCCPNAASVTD
jgi:hypothetical protein